MSEILSLYDELHARGLVREAVIGLVKPCILAREYVTLVGSTVENGSGNDIDILVRGPEDRHIRTRLQKLFPEEMLHKVHLVWEHSSPGVPHDTYIPMYDLVLVPCENHSIVEMSAGVYKPMRSFIPPKTTVNTFFEEKDFMEYLGKNEGKKYAVEEKFNGFRGIAHKRGEEVKIFSDQGRDVTDAFPSVVSQLKELTSKDFIIDGELVLYENGKPAGRADLIKFVVGKEHPSDAGIIYHVFDIMYLG
jgi:hypothetical protein